MSYKIEVYTTSSKFVLPEMTCRHDQEWRLASDRAKDIMRNGLKTIDPSNKNVTLYYPATCVRVTKEEK